MGEVRFGERLGEVDDDDDEVAAGGAVPLKTSVEGGFFQMSVLGQAESVNIEAMSKDMISAVGEGVGE